MGTILKHDPSFNIKLKRYAYIVGVDPGVNTGLAVWNVGRQAFTAVQTTCPISAMEFLKYQVMGPPVLFRIEDARQRKWFGKKGVESKEGAGWAKAHSDFWERFCRYHEQDFDMVHPKDIAPWGDNKPLFESITKYTARTSNHSREACALCFKYQ